MNKYLTGDGVSLTSIAHPRAPWWKRVCNSIRWWIRPPRISADAIEKIDITIGPEYPNGHSSFNLKNHFIALYEKASADIERNYPLGLLGQWPMKSRWTEDARAHLLEAILVNMRALTARGAQRDTLWVEQLLALSHDNHLHFCELMKEITQLKAEAAASERTIRTVMKRNSDQAQLIEELNTDNARLRKFDGCKEIGG